MNLPSRANFHLSSEVLLMFFHRSEYAKVPLEPFGIVVLNKVFNHGNQACSIGETFPVISFSFQNSPESFHGPVINTLGNSGHALGHSGFGQHAVERTVGVLVSSITVKQRMCISLGCNCLSWGTESPCRPAYASYWPSGEIITEFGFSCC